MGTGQHEGAALLIFVVSTLAQLIQLAQELRSTAKIAAWNIQGFHPIFEIRVQEPAASPKLLDAEVITLKTCHRGK